MVLYGFQVQGIQKYIFSSNKLKDIVGASALIDSLAKETFQDFLQALGVEKIEPLRAAGGTGIYLLDEKSKDAVRLWPLFVELNYPGLQMSWASEPMKSVAEVGGDRIHSLYQRMEQARNKQFFHPHPDTPLAKKAPRTGLPAVKSGKKELLDAEMRSKETFLGDDQRGAVEKKYLKGVDTKELVTDVGKLSSDKFKNYVAVIHIDGNNLGALNLQFNETMKSKKGEDYIKAYRDFIQMIETATQNAYREAWNKHVREKKEKGIYEARTILLGGDDVTLIISPESALPFTETFLSQFESETKEGIKKLFGKDGGLTACAGIAFVKSNYPFFKSVDIAEALCSRAKLDSKQLNAQDPPSSAAILKISGESLEDYSEYISKKREWLVGEKLIHFGSGTLMLKEKEGFLSLKEFQEIMKTLKSSGISIGALKDVGAKLHRSWDDAGKRYKRVKEVTPSEKEVFNKLEKVSNENESGLNLFLHRSETRGKTSKEVWYYYLGDIVALLDFEPLAEGADS